MVHIKRISSILITLTILSLLIFNANDVLERKESRIKYMPFFKQDENTDVLLLGSSHMKNAVFPMRLWKKYGIVSYNLGSDGCRIPCSYYILKSALKYASPKLVVIDCWGLDSPKKVSGDQDIMHFAFDAFPFNGDKIKAMTALFDDKKTRTDMIWKYSIYHSRWSDLNEADFSYDYSKEKGAEGLTDVVIPQEMEVSSDNLRIEEQTPNMEYLQRIIEMCQNRNIDVLLIYIPFPANAEEQRVGINAEEIAADYGVDYIDLLKNDFINATTDYGDATSHLNISGGRKITDFLGRYIIEHYKVYDRRKDSKYLFMYDDYNDYLELSHERLKTETSLGSYLMLLSNENYDIYMKLTNHKIYDNEFYMNLIYNIGIDKEKLTDSPTYISYVNEKTSVEDNVLIGIDYPEVDEDIIVYVADRETKELLDIVAFSFDTKDDVAEDIIVSTGTYRWTE